jgi:hypothetical protein
MIRRAIVMLSIFVVGGCAGVRLQGTVVGCGDKKPIDGAKLSVEETSMRSMGTEALLNKNAAKPAVAGTLETGKDGAFTLDVLGGSNASYSVKAEKDGFAPVESNVASGQPAAMCMDPAPKESSKLAKKK